MDAGIITQRTMVASSKIAIPKPKPICCNPIREPVKHPQNTATMISAAPVIRRPVDRMPNATASVVSPVRS